MTLIISHDQFKIFKEYLDEKGYSFEERPHQHFLARKVGLVVNLYNNGKIVISGKDENERKEIEQYLKSIQAEKHIENEKHYRPIEVSGIRIGTDEVGKGDYFGPLIIAGVLADESQIKKLEELGIKDSKSFSDTTIQNFVLKIKEMLSEKQYDIVTISPIKYNLLHKRMKNVNRILGWGHARAIENILKSNPECKTAISDQFGDQSFIENALMKQGKKIKLIQTPKAEREMTVATASILARSEFINRMNEMNESFEMEFPKGATDVIPTAEMLVKTYGSKVLLNVAKIHFKTTKQINNVSLDELNEIDQLKTPITDRDLHDKRSSDLLLESFNLISSFEQTFRKFIESKLKNHYGKSWWEKGIDLDIRKKAEKLWNWENTLGKKVALMDCLEMDHYRRIITNPRNWERVFQPIFQDKEMFLARMRILKSVRNPVAHSRGSFSFQDKLDIISCIQYFRRMIET